METLWNIIIISIFLLISTIDCLRLDKTGVIFVYHGSRDGAPNEHLMDVVKRFKKETGTEIAEAGHLGKSRPSIMEAFQSCVEQGATNIVCLPFFLTRTRHVQDDVPVLMAEAASRYDGVGYTIADPLGMSFPNSVVDLIQKSVEKATSSESI